MPPILTSITSNRLFVIVSFKFCCITSIAIQIMTDLLCIATKFSFGFRSKRPVCSFILLYEHFFHLFFLHRKLIWPVRGRRAAVAHKWMRISRRTLFPIVPFRSAFSKIEPNQCQLFFASLQFRFFSFPRNHVPWTWVAFLSLEWIKTARMTPTYHYLDSFVRPCGSIFNQEPLLRSPPFRVYLTLNFFKLKQKPSELFKVKCNGALSLEWMKC